MFHLHNSTDSFRLSSELKELIALHSSMSPLGGDLKSDTVTIIGATLDLQEKVVKQVSDRTSVRFQRYRLTCLHWL
jgi:hypothetical protein